MDSVTFGVIVFVLILLVILFFVWLIASGPVVATPIPVHLKDGSTVVIQPGTSPIVVNGDGSVTGSVTLGSVSPEFVYVVTQRNRSVILRALTASNGYLTVSGGMLSRSPIPVPLDILWQSPRTATIRVASTGSTSGNTTQSTSGLVYIANIALNRVQDADLVGASTGRDQAEEIIEDLAEIPLAG